MNWAALLSFLHPMLACIICGVWILWILKKNYSKEVIDENRIEMQTKE